MAVIGDYGVAEIFAALRLETRFHLRYKICANLPIGDTLQKFASPAIERAVWDQLANAGARSGIGIFVFGDIKTFGAGFFDICQDAGCLAPRARPRQLDM